MTQEDRGPRTWYPAASGLGSRRRLPAAAAVMLAALASLQSLPAAASPALSPGTAPGAPAGAPGTAPAPVEDVAKAKAAFQRAEVLYRQGELRGALAAYKEALGHKRLSAFLFNIAQCHRLLGEHKQALFFYKLFLSEEPSPPNKDEVAGRIQEMQTKVDAEEQAEKQKGRLSVFTRPAGAQVYIDGLTGPPAGTSPLFVTLPPGTHLVIIRRPGQPDVTRPVELKPGQLTHVEIVLDPQRPRMRPADRPRDAGAVTPPPRQDPPPGATPPAPLPFTRRWWFAAGLSVTAASLITAIATGATALKLHDRWEENEGAPAGDPDLKSRGEAYRLATDLLIGAGAVVGVATLVGAVLAARAARRERAGARVRVVPSCGHRGCGVALSGAF